MTHPILEEKRHDSATVMADNGVMLPPKWSLALGMTVCYF
jgi:hypothetical protein